MCVWVGGGGGAGEGRGRGGKGREGEGGEYIVHYNKVHEVEQCLAVRFILVLFHCRIVVSKYFLYFSAKFTALLRGFSWW